MKKSIKSIIIIVLVLGIGGTGGYFGYKYFFQDKVASAEVDISEIEIKDFTYDSIGLTATITLDIDTTVEATFVLENMTISYESDSLGAVTLNKTEFNTQQFEYNVYITIDVSAPGLPAYYKVIRDFIAEDTITFELSSIVRFTGALSALPEDSITKDIIIDSLGGISYSIESYQLMDMDNESVSLSIETKFSNPSELSMNIPGIILEGNFNETIQIDPIIIENFEIQTGDNDLNFETNISTVNNSLIEDFISQENLNFDFDCRLYFDNPTTIAAYPILFSDTINIPGLNPNPVVTSMELVSTNEDQMIFDFEIQIDNPSALSLNFSKIWIDIYYNSTIIGNASSSHLAFDYGLNNYTLTAILGGNQSAMEEILGNYINGEDTDFDLDVKLNITLAGNESVFEILYEMPFTFEGCSDPLIGIDDLDISLTLDYTIGGATWSLVTDVDITINNPMPFNISISDFDGEIIYKDIYNIGDVDLAAQGSLTYPVNITGSSAISDSVSLTPTIVLAAAQALYSDRPTVLVDILEGTIDLQIGNFHIVVNNVELHDIEVPITLF